MPGELQVNRITSDVASPIRLVREQDHRIGHRHTTQSLAQVGPSFENVVRSGEPQSFLLPLESDRAVSQNRNGMRLQNVDDLRGVSVKVVIAQYCQNTRR